MPGEPLPSNSLPPETNQFDHTANADQHTAALPLETAGQVIPEQQTDTTTEVDHRSTHQTLTAVQQPIVAAFETVDISPEAEDALLNTGPDDIESLNNLLYNDLDYEFENLQLEQPPVAAVTSVNEGAVPSSTDQTQSNNTPGAYRIPKIKRTVISPIVFDQPTERSPSTKKAKKEVKRLGHSARSLRRQPTSTVTSGAYQGLASTPASGRSPNEAIRHTTSVFSRLDLSKRCVNTATQTAANTAPPAEAVAPQERAGPSSSAIRRRNRGVNKLEREKKWLGLHNPALLQFVPAPGEKGKVDTKKFNQLFAKEQARIIKELIKPALDESGFVQPMVLVPARPTLSTFVPPPPQSSVLNLSWAEEDAKNYGEHRRRVQFDLNQYQKKKK